MSLACSGLVLIAMAPMRGSRKRMKTSQEWWDFLSKRSPGLISRSKGMDDFSSFFRISRNTFDYICSHVKEHMTAKPTNFAFSNGEPLIFYDKVAIALRRLSSGETLVEVAELFGTAHSTVSQVTWQFVEAMEENGLHRLQWPSTEEEMTEIKSEFEKLTGVPNCCGAIDTTHIKMRVPSTNPTAKMWVDRKNNQSMILQAIVDPDLKFRDVVTGWPGQLTDSTVLQSSNFFTLCKEGERLNGEVRKLSNSTQVREYIVGDSAFPLLPWLMTPYQGKNSQSQAQFNKQLFETQLVAQRALAMLKEKWKIIKGLMWRPDKNKLPRVILVCCILHNIVIDMNDENLDELMTLSENHDPEYDEEVCGLIDETAAIMRDKLSLYLSGSRRG